MVKLTEIYDVKIEGILLTTNQYYKIVFTKVNKPKSIYIFLNNQAAIPKMGTISPRLGQVVAIGMAKISEKLKAIGIE